MSLNTGSPAAKSTGSLSKEIENLKYDKRLTEWHVSRGKISREDLNKHLQSLPDSAGNVESFDLNPVDEEAAATVEAGGDEGSEF